MRISWNKRAVASEVICLETEANVFTINVQYFEKTNTVGHINVMFEDLQFTNPIIVSVCVSLSLVLTPFSYSISASCEEIFKVCFF